MGGACHPWNDIICVGVYLVPRMIHFMLYGSESIDTGDAVLVESGCSDVVIDLCDDVDVVVAAPSSVLADVSDECHNAKKSTDVGVRIALSVVPTKIVSVQNRIRVVDVNSGDLIGVNNGDSLDIADPHFVAHRYRRGKEDRFSPGKQKIGVRFRHRLFIRSSIVPMGYYSSTGSSYEENLARGMRNPFIVCQTDDGRAVLLFKSERNVRTLAFPDPLKLHFVSSLSYGSKKFHLIYGEKGSVVYSLVGALLNAEHGTSSVQISWANLFKDMIKELEVITGTSIITMFEDSDPYTEGCSSV
jgi:hypothetical protein